MNDPSKRTGDPAGSTPKSAPAPAAAAPDQAAPQQREPDPKGGNGIVVGARRKGDFNRLAILGLLVVVTLAIFPIVKIFFVPVVVAATFATLFFPLYQRILKLFANNRGVSAFATCFIIFICLVTPTYIVVQLVVNQAIDLYQTAEPVVKDIVSQGGKSQFLVRIQEWPIIQRLQLSSINFAVPINEGIKTLATVSTKVLNKTSTGLLEAIVNIFIMFFTMFYFFMDGRAFIKRIKHLSPIRDDYEDMIVSRFLLISRASVLGTVIIGLTQGTIGAIALLIFGVKLWLLWGFIMIILSLIPFMGAWMVLLPTGIILIITGHIGAGIGIILTSLFFVSTIDNFMRPRLVGHGAKLHDLVIFFSSLGGIAVFGVMGFIVGPVIAALFVAVLDIYSREFEQQLKKTE
jgi:predicted PurR-regulated permease PerM